MEANSDKRIREKLQGIEASFDPQAWEQMEALLDERKKRRGFFWWWFTGSIAAGALLFVAGYEFRDMKGEGALTLEEKQEVVTASGRQAKVDIATSGNGSVVLSASEINQLTDMASSQKQKHNKAAVEKEKVKTGEHIQLGHNAMGAGHQAGIAENNQQARKVSVEAKAENNTSAIPFQVESPLSSPTMAEEMTTGFSSTHWNVPAAVSTSTPSSKQAETILLHRKEADKLTSVLAEELVVKKEDDEDALPQKKKRVFNYSLGVLANFTGTTLGNQKSVETGKSYFFYKEPTYAVGLTHDFLFLNRLALSNSILYAQTGLGVERPVAPPDSSAITNSYSAVIRELQIPLGVKVYPVVKNGFRFSLSAGFIHHIKLSEVFTVKKELIPPPVPPQNAFDENTFTTVLSNSFTPASENKNISLNENGDVNQEAEYYATGGLKRYYASFYASAGLEYMTRKRLVIFAEPLFYMSLRKVGMQNQHKYNLGANAGLRYQF